MEKYIGKVSYRINPRNERKMKRQINIKEYRTQLKIPHLQIDRWIDIY